MGDFVEEIIVRYDEFAQNFDGNILFGEFSENWVNDNFVEGSAEREWWSVLKNLKYQNISLSAFSRQTYSNNTERKASNIGRLSTKYSIPSSADMGTATRTLRICRLDRGRRGVV